MFCLPLTLLGPLLAWFALREIRRGYQNTGRGLAIGTARGGNAQKWEAQELEELLGANAPVEQDQEVAH